jgi:phospholipase C
MAPATAIKHLVVLYDENVSFDHYFGTYPRATNPPSYPAFHAAPGTPAVNGLTPALLNHNPNADNPRPLGRSELVVCDNNHSYTGEQQAFDHRAMDRFVQTLGPHGSGCNPATVMDYYNGNTVTALWNYAQRFAMSDNSYDATFGPTLLGHLNLVAGQTRGAVAQPRSSTFKPMTISTNLAAAYEDCAPRSLARATVVGRNVGDLLSRAGVTWGWFSAGFRPTARRSDGTAVCGSAHRNRAGKLEPDYYTSAIAEPFQFWKSTANPHHLAPVSVAEVGHDGRANHQYDLADFWAAADAGHLPAVSFIKPAGYENGHAGTSDPLLEQRFLVETINRLQRLPDWSSTAIVIAYDDSDGWYDHQAAAISNPSHDPAIDALNGAGRCGTGRPLDGVSGRCGPGPRQPLLVISPYAKRNYVDHTLTTQVSILRFIEDNWLGGERIGGGSFDATAAGLDGMLDATHPDLKRLILNPASGEPTGAS